jgi:hypothetical protein
VSRRESREGREHLLADAVDVIRVLDAGVHGEQLRIRVIGEIDETVSSTFCSSSTSRRWSSELEPNATSESRIERYFVLHLVGIGGPLKATATHGSVGEDQSTCAVRLSICGSSAESQGT